MLLRRRGFDFHGAPPAIQRGWAEAGTTVASPGEAVVVDRGLSHFDGPEPVAARMVSVAVAIIAASLCLAFFSQSDPIQPWRTSAAAYTYNCPYGVEMPLTTLENTVLRYIAIRDFRKLPYIVWLVLALYGDSFIFILGSTMLQFSIPLGTHITACRIATVMCICFYVSTKVNTYGESLPPEALCCFVLTPANDIFYTQMLKWNDGMIGLESTGLGNPEVNNRLKKLAVRAFSGSLLTLLSTSTADGT
ncbi:hypothetical protein PG990_009438 [Apiospora arundinis]